VLAQELKRDDDLQADVGLSLMELGRLLAETSRADEGLAAYGRARTILQTLADHDPSVVPYRDALARVYHYTGDLHFSVGRYASGTVAHLQARASWEALAQTNPTVVRYRNDQARCDLYCGANLAMMGRTAAARASFERAVAILQKLAHVHPAVPEFQCDLSKCHNNIGILTLSVGTIGRGAGGI
jgi:hypothetical protein